jgi:hypothetical protein
MRVRRCERTSSACRLGILRPGADMQKGAVGLSLLVGCVFSLHDTDRAFGAYVEATSQSSTTGGPSDVSDSGQVSGSSGVTRASQSIGPAGVANGNAAASFGTLRAFAQSRADSDQSQQNSDATARAEFADRITIHTASGEQVTLRFRLPVSGSLTASGR